LGSNALNANTIGLGNTATGWQALFNNTTGIDNTALGSRALTSNTTGGSNTAVGAGALATNVGGGNTAVGDSALDANTVGGSNTAVGVLALFQNTTGTANTATGASALQNNDTGSNNIAVGQSALSNNKDGENNTCIGIRSLLNCKGSNNTAIGIAAGRNIISGNNDICIGNVGFARESNTIRIGDDTETNTFIAGISGVAVPGGVGVIIDSSGHLGTTTSSMRFKEAIKPMDKASEAILALKPVTFHYKHDLDPDGIQQFGLVAEDVEKVNPALVARDDQGKPYTVRYEAVNAMLLNEFLKEHRKVETLEATVAQQHKDFEAAVAELKGQ